MWQMKEEKSSSDVNLDLAKSTALGIPGRAYSFVLIGRNVDQWRYCLELPPHDVSPQSTFKGEFCTKYYLFLNHQGCPKSRVITLGWMCLGMIFHNMQHLPDGVSIMMTHTAFYICEH